MAAALQYQVDERSFPLEGKQGEHRLSQSKLHKKKQTAQKGGGKNPWQKQVQTWKASESAICLGKESGWF